MMITELEDVGTTFLPTSHHLGPRKQWTAEPTTLLKNRVHVVQIGGGLILLPFLRLIISDQPNSQNVMFALETYASKQIAD
jgi:hypothetical protein